MVLHSFLVAVVRKLTGFPVEKVLSLCGAQENLNKFKSLYGIREEVDKLSRELIYIQKFIANADEKRLLDHNQMHLLRDVMDITYQIEDLVDIFLLECPEKLPGIINRFKKLPKMISQIPFLYDFQKEIKLIHDRINEIKELTERYKSMTFGELKTTPSSDSGSVVNLDPIDNTEVIGFVTNVDQVVKLLLDEEHKSLAVVSIVGMGGIGKTTLARKVCNSEDVRKKFDKIIWIRVSQTYDLLEIMRKISKDLGEDSTDCNGDELGHLVWKSFEEKRFLIVLDDVWTERLWAEIAKILPSMNKGSRVLVTTRFEQVARLADTKYDPHNLEVLNYKESMELFLKYAIPRKHQCLEGTIADLYYLARKFVYKCNGLPLALVVLGRQLSTRPYKFHAWNEFLRTMSWLDEGSECSKVVATSYEHLPFAKKLCFLHFAIFPKDQKIEAKPLIRIWIAEMLIPSDERRTLEETAMCFLEDFVQRSMVEVLERSPDGLIKYCKVHDVTREIAVQKAKDMNFLMLCSKPSDWKSCSMARRVAIHYSYSDEEEQGGNHPSRSVRSLFLFGFSSKLDCSKYKLLRILASMKGEVELTNFKGSSQLRYLQLNSNKLKEKESDFGEWVKGMKCLETLDLRLSALGDISGWVWGIQTLRHLLLHEITSSKTPGPPASENLRSLQTLNGVGCGKSWETLGLPNIPEVRELCMVTKTQFSDVSFDTIRNLLDRLKHIVSLRIVGTSVDLHKISPGLQFYNNMKTLVLIARTDEPRTLDITGVMLPRHLVEIQLVGYKLGSDPMPILEELGSLNSLRISLIYQEQEDPLRRISPSAKGFKHLEELVLEYWAVLEEWRIEMGSMPILKRLRISHCPRLSVPLELMHLHSLQYLDWHTETQASKDAIVNIREQRPHLQNEFPYHSVF